MSLLTKNSLKILIFEQCFIFIKSKKYKMTVQGLKFSIHQMLEKIDDSTVLEAYRNSSTTDKSATVSNCRLSNRWYANLQRDAGKRCALRKKTD